MKGLEALNSGGGAAVKMIPKSLRAIAVKFALVAWELRLPGCLSTVSRMPQMQLPIFAEGVHLITPNLGYQREGDHIVYLHGVMPVFQHHRDDMASFKMIVSQLYINGNAKQAQLVRVFGIQALALKRWVKKYRAGGPKAFYETRRKQRATVKKSL